MTSQEVGLKIALYFAECAKIDAQPRMDKISQLVELYTPDNFKINGGWDYARYTPKQTCPDCGIEWSGYDTTDRCLHCQDKHLTNRIITPQQTCLMCGETDSYVIHNTMEGFVHIGCCLNCDMDQNIVCEACNKLRKPHTAGAKICYKCFKNNK